LLAAGFALFITFGSVQAAEKKPNILVIWGDDIGTWNISHNSRGMTKVGMPGAREGSLCARPHAGGRQQIPPNHEGLPPQPDAGGLEPSNAGETDQANVAGREIDA